MTKVDLTPFGKFKKISLNMSEDLLEIVDSLAEITKTNRTVVIGAILGKGISPYFRYLQESWQEHLKDKSLDEKKKKIISKALEDLKNLEKSKWTG